MSEQKKLGTQGSLIFMNTPIADSAEDVIGFSTYAMVVINYYLNMSYYFL